MDKYKWTENYNPDGWRGCIWATIGAVAAIFGLGVAVGKWLIS